MPTHEHFQQFKSTRLPGHDKVGACLTCSYWQVEEPRREALITRLALCVQPDLKPLRAHRQRRQRLQQVERENADRPEAKAYAKQGEKS
ncbi:MAG: hypothetical protein M3Q32_13725 [Pseudomonadota bacterium]|nr:hypothetical protein [Burkholderiales bacterium]MDQ3197376.1 hypothetical protein [Pseudomonadota bacterium]